MANSVRGAPIHTSKEPVLRRLSTLKKGATVATLVGFGTISGLVAHDMARASAVSSGSAASTQNGPSMPSQQDDGGVNNQGPQFGDFGHRGRRDGGFFNNQAPQSGGNQGQQSGGFFNQGQGGGYSFGSGGSSQGPVAGSGTS